MHGVPQRIRSDNGPEFVATTIRHWLKQVEVEVLYIEPGSPWEKGLAESFHGRLCDELLAVEVFDNLTAARARTAAWREDYNHRRPHSSLDYQSPSAFAAACAASAPAAPTLQQHTRTQDEATLLQPIPFITPGTENQGWSRVPAACGRIVSTDD